ncbi:MAG: SRPBCC family protein [Gammaproteobacteria bacterium]|nr:SRPBCC family protein [Gammaproteobacteria bacterium]
MATKSSKPSKSAEPTKVNSTTHLDVPAEQVWQMIGQFKSFADWHPAVEKSELEQGGSVRRLSLIGGGTIVERLERIDDESFKYRYSIVDSPLPVANYVSELRVVKDDSGNGCSVEWSSEFAPAAGTSTSDAEKSIRDIYDAGLNNLQSLFVKKQPG